MSTRRVQVQAVTCDADGCDIEHRHEGTALQARIEAGMRGWTHGTRRVGGSAGHGKRDWDWCPAHSKSTGDGA